MGLSGWDWMVAAAFYAVVIGVSLWKSARRPDSADYFLAGRALPWWLIGISIVAANISTEQFVGMAGQGAGGVGLAVSNWQLMGSVAVVLIAWTLLPRFLRAGIYTMPEFLEYRYNAAARSLMAVLTVVVYVGVLLTAVLYSGALTLRAIFGIPLQRGAWMVAAVAALYTSWGGLRAVAWADLFQGIALLLGGILVFGLGLRACGGWAALVAAQGGRLHMVLPAEHAGLPWTGVVGGMWIVELYYCGLNQFIVQRNLAARSLRDGQLGVIFAGALWLLVPFAIVMPGIMAQHLYGTELLRPDDAFPTLIRRLVPAGLRGFMLAAIAGAVVSSLASMLNSAATIVTMDVYQRWFDPDAPPGRLVAIGRVLTLTFVALGAMLAPRLDDPRWGGVFQFIQQFQGYIWPGVVAVFVAGFLVPHAPPAAGVAGLLAGPLFYGVFQRWAPNLHFLVQVAVAFQLDLLLIGLITLWAPLREPRMLPERRPLEAHTSPLVFAAGAAVLAAVGGFYVAFW
ncbi:MAG: sodium/solute symporter [Kiritimatiellae bacterium]|nr:sodium/solute symporter [Kiritimatiellia bacterium]